MADTQKNAFDEHAASFPVLRVLCLGDIVGRAGRQIVKETVPRLRNRYTLDMIIANGENAAGGIGITKDTATELFEAGIDVITTGNHVWRHASCQSYLAKEPRLLRPANYPPGAPGAGIILLPLPKGHMLAVINLLGRTYMDAVDCPFHAAEQILSLLPPEATVRIIDFHAEATSEKRALGHFLDGKVTAVLGTHTHVQTADAMVLPGGTAYLSDLGMCGCEYISVLGVQKEASINRFYTGLPHSFSAARGQTSINGALLEIDLFSGKTHSIQIIRGQHPGTAEPILLP